MIHLLSDPPPLRVECEQLAEIRLSSTQPTLADELLAALREVTDRYEALDNRLAPGACSNGTVTRARAAIRQGGGPVMSATPVQVRTGGVVRGTCAAFLSAARAVAKKHGDPTDRACSVFHHGGDSFEVRDYDDRVVWSGDAHCEFCARAEAVLAMSIDKVEGRS